MENRSTVQVWNHLQKNDSLFYAIVNREITEENLERIRTNPNKFIPPVLFATAQYIFQNKDKDEAVFWYYVALLRAMNDTQQNELLFDRNKHIVFIYTQIFGRSIETYTTTNIQYTEKQILAACDYVRENHGLYSSAWIYLDGAEQEKDIPDIIINSQENKKQRLLTVNKFEENLNKYLKGKLTDEFKYK